MAALHHHQPVSPLQRANVNDTFRVEPLVVFVTPLKNQHVFVDLLEVELEQAPIAAWGLGAASLNLPHPLVDAPHPGLNLAGCDPGDLLGAREWLCLLVFGVVITREVGHEHRGLATPGYKRKDSDQAGNVAMAIARGISVQARNDLGVDLSSMRLRSMSSLTDSGSLKLCCWIASPWCDW